MSIIANDIDFILSSSLPWERFYKKSVLITGAAGALPSYMVKTLLYLNNKLEPSDRCKIYALVRNESMAKSVFKNHLDRADLSLVIQDVASPLKLDKDIHIIIHAASQASPKYYSIDPVGTLSANVFGTQQLLSFAQAHKTEDFLFFSSSEVYGQPIDEQLKETDFGALDPATLRACYAESKRFGETMCIAWGHQYGVPIKIVRPFHTYGPGFKLDDGRVFADFISDIVHHRNIVLNSDGSAVRAYCYISDATRAFFTVLLKGEYKKAYNVGNPEACLSVKQLAELLVCLFPERKLKLLADKTKSSNYLASTISKNIPDISRIRALGWVPNVMPEEGFLRTVKSYENIQNPISSSTI